MSTAQDLAIIALSASDREVGQGDLSLALAGAEVLDLAEAQVIGLDGERLVPGTGSAAGDRLLDEAAATVVRQEPYESVEDWLWRRGRELSAAYTDELERAGLVNRTRGSRLPVEAGAGGTRGLPRRPPGRGTPRLGRTRARGPRRRRRPARPGGRRGRRRGRGDGQDVGRTWMQAMTSTTTRP